MTKAELKGKVWETLKSTNAKIALIAAFVVGYQELMPMIKDALGFTADNQAVIEECKKYTDDKIESKEGKAEMYLDILTSDIVSIKDYIRNDSLTSADRRKKFAVGFRSDLNGIMSYRNKFGTECATRINPSTREFEFYDIRKDKWLRCFYED